MKNHSIIAKIFFILLLLAAVLAINYFVKEASLKSSRIIGEITALETRNETLKKLQVDYSKIEPDVEEVTNLLPSRRTFNIFIDHINNLAKNTNTTLALEFEEGGGVTTNQSKKPAPKTSATIPVQATATGSRESVYAFFDALEKSPHFIKVNSFDFTQDSAGSNELILQVEVYVDTINK